MLTHIGVLILLAIAMACCGDLSGLAVIGTVVLYGVAFFGFIWFLSVTGVPGLLLVCGIYLMIIFILHDKN